MKEFLIPYLVGKKGGWWSGIDFYNHSTNDTAITIKVYRPDGTTRKTIDETVKPFHHYLMTPDDFEIGRATVRIYCSDDVYISPFMGNESGYSEIKIYELSKN